MMKLMTKCIAHAAKLPLKAMITKKNQVESTTFSEGAFIRWQGLWPSLAKHQKSKQHGAARDHFARNLLNLENNDAEFVGNTLIANVCSDQKENKEFLRQSFLATRLLTKQSLAFQGKTDLSSNFWNVMDHMSEAFRRKHKLQE